MCQGRQAAGRQHWSALQPNKQTTSAPARKSSTMRWMSASVGFTPCACAEQQGSTMRQQAAAGWPHFAALGGAASTAASSGCMAPNQQAPAQRTPSLRHRLHCRSGAHARVESGMCKIQRSGQGHTRALVCCFSMHAAAPAATPTPQGQPQAPHRRPAHRRGSAPHRPGMGRRTRYGRTRGPQGDCRGTTAPQSCMPHRARRSLHSSGSPTPPVSAPMAPALLRNPAGAHPP